MMVIYAMGCVLVVWGTLALIGWGLAAGLLRLSGFNDISPKSEPAWLWLGAGVAVLLLQVLHLFLPLGAGIGALVILVAALPGWYWGPRPRWGAMRDWVKAHRGAAWVGLMFILWAANRAVGESNHFDTGAYHATSVRWIATFPTVLGLGNLHDRLAFNNSLHLLHAALEFGPLRGRSQHMVNSFFVVLSFVVAWPRVVRWWGPGDVSPAQRVGGAMGLALLMLVGISLSQVWMSTPSTDIAAALAVVVAALLMAESAFGRRDPRVDGFVAAGILAFAITLKVSVATVAVIAWPVAIWLMGRRWHDGRWRWSWPLGRFVAAFLFASLLVGVWLIRGGMMSGFPLYPSGLFALDGVWWQVPEAVRQNQLDIIASFARTTHEARDVTGGWVLPWFQQVVLLRAPFMLALPMLLTLVAAPFWLRALRRREGRWLGLVTAGVILGTAVWFLKAPSPRMGMGLWWALAGLGFSAAVLFRTPPGWLRRWLVVGVVLGMFLPTMHRMALVDLRYRHDPLMVQFYGKRAWTLYPLVLAGSDVGFHPYPEPPIEPVEVVPGLRVYVGQEVGDLVYDAPLPAVRRSTLSPRLRLRNPGNLADGFYTSREEEDQSSLPDSSLQQLAD